jgi:hypothetical protein
MALLPPQSQHHLLDQTPLPSMLPEPEYRRSRDRFIGAPVDP